MQRKLDAQILAVLVGRAFVKEALPLTVYPIDLHILTESLNKYFTPSKENL